MNISLHLFISFFFFFSVSSVFTTIRNKCLSNDDCQSNEICHQQTSTCHCSQPYFWHSQRQICSYCPLNWIEFQIDKCLQFVYYQTGHISSYEHEKLCQSLIAQSIRLTNLDELNQIKNLLDNHQSLSIDIHPRSINSSLWCNRTKTNDQFQCLQIRKDDKYINRICFEYVSCLQPTYFLCESDFKNQISQNRFIRALTTKHVIIATTKKSWNIDANNAINVAGGVVGGLINLADSIWGKKPATQPTPVDNSHVLVPQALADDDEDGENFFMDNLSYIAIGGGILLLVIVIILVIVCTKKKSNSRYDSEESMESYTSETD